MCGELPIVLTIVGLLIQHFSSPVLYSMSSLKVSAPIVTCLWEVAEVIASFLTLPPNPACRTFLMNTYPPLPAPSVPFPSGSTSVPGSPFLKALGSSSLASSSSKSMGVDPASPVMVARRHKRGKASIFVRTSNNRWWHVTLHTPWMWWQLVGSLVVWWRLLYSHWCLLFH